MDIRERPMATAGIKKVFLDFTEAEIVFTLVAGPSAAVLSGMVCFCLKSLQFSKPRNPARVFRVVIVGADSYFTFPQIRFRVVWLNATPVTSYIFSDNRSKS